MPLTTESIDIEKYRSQLIEEISLANSAAEDVKPDITEKVCDKASDNAKPVKNEDSNYLAIKRTPHPLLHLLKLISQNKGSAIRSAGCEDCPDHDNFWIEISVLMKKHHITKTPKQWERYWGELTERAKQNFAASQESGLPPSQLDMRIMKIISEDVNGDTSKQESQSALMCVEEFIGMELPINVFEIWPPKNNPDLPLNSTKDDSEFILPDFPTMHSPKITSSEERNSTKTACTAKSKSLKKLKNKLRDNRVDPDGLDKTQEIFTNKKDTILVVDSPKPKTVPESNTATPKPLNPDKEDEKVNAVKNESTTSKNDVRINNHYVPTPITERETNVKRIFTYKPTPIIGDNSAKPDLVTDKNKSVRKAFNYKPKPIASEMRLEANQRGQYAPNSESSSPKQYPSYAHLAITPEESRSRNVSSGTLAQCTELEIITRAIMSSAVVQQHSDSETQAKSSRPLLKVRDFAKTLENSTTSRNEPVDKNQLSVKSNENQLSVKCNENQLSVKPNENQSSVNINENQRSVNANENQLSEKTTEYSARTKGLGNRRVLKVLKPNTDACRSKEGHENSERPDHSNKDHGIGIIRPEPQGLKRRSTEVSGRLDDGRPLNKPEDSQRHASKRPKTNDVPSQRPFSNLDASKTDGFKTKMFRNRRIQVQLDSVGSNGNGTSLNLTEPKLNDAEKQRANVSKTEEENQRALRIMVELNQRQHGLLERLTEGFLQIEQRRLGFDERLLSLVERMSADKNTL